MPVLERGLMPVPERGLMPVLLSDVTIQDYSTIVKFLDSSALNLAFDDLMLLSFLMCFSLCSEKMCLS